MNSIENGSIHRVIVSREGKELCQFTTKENIYNYHWLYSSSIAGVSPQSRASVHIIPMSFRQPLANQPTHCIRHDNALVWNSLYFVHFAQRLSESLLIHIVRRPVFRPLSPFSLVQNGYSNNSAENAEAHFCIEVNEFNGRTELQWLFERCHKNCMTNACIHFNSLIENLLCLIGYNHLDNCP